MLILLGAVIISVFLFRFCTSYFSNKLKTSVKNMVGGKKTEFLEGIDFTEGGYSLILDDTKPYLVIDDVAVLKANQNTIDLDRSWMNYLPGEGRGHYGLRLYKNNILIDAKLARKFKTFKIGNIREHGKPAVRKSIYEPRASFLRQKDSLEKNKNVFISRTTEVNKEGYEYHFTLSCPSVLVSQRDTTFNEFEYGENFADRIKQSLSGFTGFSMGNNASNRLKPDPLLTLKKEGTTHYLRNDQTNNTIVLKGYDLRGASLVFFCTKEFYEQVKSHDFSSTFIRVGLQKEDIAALIAEKIGPDSEEIKAAEVLTSLMEFDFHVGKAYESKYELRYFEVVSP